MDENEVYISEQNIKEFEELYNAAVKDKEEIFVFEGHVVLTLYAKYVLEYFNSKIHTNDNSC